MTHTSVTTGWIVWAYDHGSLRLEHRCGYLVPYDTSVSVDDMLAEMRAHVSGGHCETT